MLALLGSTFVTVASADSDIRYQTSTFYYHGQTWFWASGIYNSYIEYNGAADSSYSINRIGLDMRIYDGTTGNFLRDLPAYGSNTNAIAVLNVGENANWFGPLVRDIYTYFTFEGPYMNWYPSTHDNFVVR